MTNKAVFLDRDGVINVEKDYVHQIEEFDFLPGVFTAVKAFQQAGYLIIIITNQAGIGRGYYTEQQFYALTAWMKREFSAHHITIDGVYFCPHHPTHGMGEYKVNCACRKPNPGMLIQAQQDHNIDMANSLLIGDKISDIHAGKNAGVAKNYFVTTGHSIKSEHLSQADEVFASLAEACNTILNLTECKAQ